MSDDFFSLPAPIGFNPIPEDARFSGYRRKLPHWRINGGTYFCTFRLRDSVPKSCFESLARLKRAWRKRNPGPWSLELSHDWERLRIRRIESLPDRNEGVCFMRDRFWTDLLAEILMSHHGKTAQISSWAILPNHAHVCIRPFENFKLETILGQVKSKFAWMLNKSLRQKRKMWARETFDRIIRDCAHLQQVINFIGRNPEKAGLNHEAHWRRWLDPDWRALGWSFAD